MHLFERERAHAHEPEEKQGRERESPADFPAEHGAGLGAQSHDSDIMT